MNLREFMNILDKSGFTTDGDRFGRADVCTCNHDCDNDCDYCGCNDCEGLYLYEVRHDDDDGWYIEDSGETCSKCSANDTLDDQQIYLKNIEYARYDNGKLRIFEYDGTRWTLSEESTWDWW